MTELLLTTGILALLLFAFLSVKKKMNRGVILVALLGLLLVFLAAFPISFSRTSDSAQRAYCANHLQQIASAVRQYVPSHRGMPSSVDDCPELMKVFTEHPELRLCPGTGSRPPDHFLYWNERGFTEDAVLRDEVPLDGNGVHPFTSRVLD